MSSSAGRAVFEEDAIRVTATTVAPGLDAEIEPRSGYAAHLTIVDTDTLQWEAVPAFGASSVPVAGTQLGLLATHQHVGAAISDDCGPNSYIVLESGGISIYLSGTCKTARAAIEQFNGGKLATIYAPTSFGAPEPAGASWAVPRARRGGTCAAGRHGRRT